MRPMPCSVACAWQPCPNGGHSAHPRYRGRAAHPLHLVLPLRGLGAAASRRTRSQERHRVSRVMLGEINPRAGEEVGQAPPPHFPRRARLRPRKRRRTRATAHRRPLELAKKGDRRGIPKKLAVILGSAGRHRLRRLHLSHCRSTRGDGRPQGEAAAHVASPAAAESARATHIIMDSVKAGNITVTPEGPELRSKRPVERPYVTLGRRATAGVRLELEELQVAVRRLRSSSRRPARQVPEPALLSLRQQAADAQRATTRGRRRSSGGAGARRASAGPQGAGAGN